MSKIGQQRADHWCALIAEQERSGQSVRAFCQQHEVNEHSFYQWRKRLATQAPMKFALVQTEAPVSGESGLELMLGNGERLRIASGFDAATLRAVLGVLRHQ